MNTNRYFIGSIVVFVFIVLYQLLLHNVVLAGMYEKAAHLMRDGGTAQFIWLLIAFLIMAFGFCYIFTKGYENKGIGEGIRYGLIIAVTFCITGSLIQYAVYPIPASWAIGWIIGSVIQWIIAGILVAAIYRPSPAAAM